jgi:hypothetical protein
VWQVSLSTSSTFSLMSSMPRTADMEYAMLSALSIVCVHRTRMPCQAPSARRPRSSRGRAVLSRVGSPPDERAQQQQSAGGRESANAEARGTHLVRVCDREDVAARDGVGLARDADEDRALGRLHLVLDMLINVPQLLLGNEHRARGPSPRQPRAPAACPLAARASPPSPPNTPHPQALRIHSSRLCPSEVTGTHGPLAEQNLHTTVLGPTGRAEPFLTSCKKKNLTKSASG